MQLHTFRLAHVVLVGLLCHASVCAKVQEGHSSGQRLDSLEKDVVLDEFVVTGTGTERLLKNAPVQTEVITKKMIESYGGSSIEDILGSLSASFGFDRGDMGSQMQLNGLGNNYILILIDGKRIHGDVGGENDLGLIDPHNIERIEIVKGAQSALYGSDAMAGVINIITKKREKDGLQIENTIRYGSHNDLRQHDGVNIGIGKVTSYTNFQLQHTDGWQNTADQYAEGKVLHDTKTKTVNEYTNWQIAERISYNPKKDLEFYVDGSYYTKTIFRPTDGKYPSCDVYTYNLMYRNASASCGSKYTIDEKKKDVLTVDVDWNLHDYYYKYTARTYEYMKLEGAEYGDLNGEWYSVPFYPGNKNLQNDQQRIMAQVKSIIHLPNKNTLNSGLEYRWDYLHAPLRTENGSANDWTAAAYVQDEFDKIEWFNATGGLRLVVNERFGVRLTPKLSTMFSLGDFRIRLGWSQGFKTPTVKELHYRYLHVMGSSTIFNMGNVDLKPQTNNYWSASGEYRGRKVTVSLTGYYNSLVNMIALVNVPVEEIPSEVQVAYMGDGSGKVQARMYKNMEDAKTWGEDINIAYKIYNDLTLNASYSYLDTKAHVYDSNRDRVNEVVIDGMAHHKWSASAVYSHRFKPEYKLGLNLSARGSSMRYYQNNGNAKPFTLCRLNTTHDFGKEGKKLSYRAELGVDNIFNFIDDTMHPYHLGTKSSGTTFFASFNIRFNQGKKLKSYKLKNIKSSENED